MSNWTVHTGDCIKVLAGMEANSVDAVVTDPPYGIGFPYLGYEDTRDNLARLIEGFMPHALRIASRVIVLCGPTQIGMYPQANWVGAVVWNTTGSFGKCGYNQWTPVLVYGKDRPGFGRVEGMLKSDVIQISGGASVGFQRSDAEKKHTCPKPIGLMRDVVRRYTEPGTTILDPFMGSGTTGVACIETGRRFIGIEQEPEYADIARARIASASSPMFA